MTQGLSCLSCGSQNRSGYQFCGACGDRLISSCPHCGASGTPGYRFCTNCGRDVSGEMQQQAEPLPLGELVYSEQELLDLLGIEKQRLDCLRRQEDFPVVHLGRKARVYLAEDVLRWLKKRTSV